MNKRNIDELLLTYRESMGTTRKLPITKPAVQAWRRPAYSAAFVVVLMASSAVALWPRNATAKRFQDMTMAIKNARSMVVTGQMQGHSHRWRTISHTMYQDGKVRCENYLGTPIESVSIWSGGLVLTDLKAKPHALLESASNYEGSPLGTDGDGLDYARQLSDEGDAGIERQVTIRSHPPVNGRATYLMIMSRPKSEETGLSYHGEILVDKMTNLPLEIYVGDGGFNAPTKNQNHWLFDFNPHLDIRQFDLTCAKPIVRLENAEQELTGKWSSSLLDYDGLSIRDASVCPDGTIWIAMSRKAGSRGYPFTISCSNGQTYLRTHVLVPSDCWGKRHIYSLRGDQVFVAGFSPLHVGGKLPERVKVSVAKPTVVNAENSSTIQSIYVNELDAEPRTTKNVTMGPTAILDLRKESGKLPSYFVALDLDHFSPQIPRNIWLDRALASERRHDYRSAAMDREQAAEADQSFIPWLGEAELKKAIKLYRLAGLESEAKRTETKLAFLIQKVNR